MSVANIPEAYADVLWHHLQEAEEHDDWCECEECQAAAREALPKCRVCKETECHEAGSIEVRIESNGVCSVCNEEGCS
jgi:hypothetical protein